MKPRLKEKYDSELAAQLKDQLGLDNVMQVPRLEKIVVNMGVGDATQDGKLIDAAVEDLRIITGQQPRINRARKSVANFKLREGQAIGAHVTLRGVRMWEFFDRLVALAIPRIRDFRGLSRFSPEESLGRSTIARCIARDDLARDAGRRGAAALGKAPRNCTGRDGCGFARCFRAASVVVPFRREGRGRG